MRNGVYLIEIYDSLRLRYISLPNALDGGTIERTIDDITLCFSADLCTWSAGGVPESVAGAFQDHKLLSLVVEIV